MIVILFTPFLMPLGVFSVNLYYPRIVSFDIVCALSLGTIKASQVVVLNEDM